MKKLLSLLLACVFVVTIVPVSFAELVLPDAVTVIESEAFADCEDVEILTIYNSDATIAEDALDGSGIHTIRCHRDAEQIIDFAGRHNIDVEYLDAEPDVTIWVGGSIADLTVNQAAAFKRAYPQYADITVNIVSMSESEAVDNLQQADDQPDIFGFAQDQLVVLKGMGKLDPVINAAGIRNRNSAGSVSAAEVGGTLYAYPMTADNGYFLYYDKSVVTDPSSMESILASCESAGKKFYMQINSGWYQVAYFFGAGCSMEFMVSDSGEFESVDISYANPNGLQAMKSLIKTIGSDSFVNGSSADEAENWAALVSGTWDSEGARAYLGNNFAAAKLPTIDGYQMKSYGGFKMFGVTPQEDDNKRTLCHALADWLTNESCQLERFSEVGWGPSNMAAQQNEAVQGNQALNALAEQAAYAVPQGQIHGGYWALATALIEEIMNGEFNEASDDLIMARLLKFEDDIKALLAPRSPADVGISLPTAMLQRWYSDGTVMMDYLEDAGLSVDLRFADNDVDTQKTDIKEMIEEGVGVLIISAVDSTSLDTVLEEAMDADVSIISILLRRP